MDQVRDGAATMKRALALTCVVLAVEVAGGLLSHSLALLADPRTSVAATATSA
jgi:Co/Zn/Cd efflux system component